MITHIRIKTKPWVATYKEPWSGKKRQKAFKTEQEAKDFDTAQNTVFERERSIIRATKRRRRKAAPTSATVEEVLNKYLDTLGNPTTREPSAAHYQYLWASQGTLPEYRRRSCLSQSSGRTRSRQRHCDPSGKNLPDSVQLGSALGYAFEYPPLPA